MMNEGQFTKFTDELEEGYTEVEICLIAYGVLPEEKEG